MCMCTHVAQTSSEMNEVLIMGKLGGVSSQKHNTYTIVTMLVLLHPLPRIVLQARSAAPAAAVRRSKVSHQPGPVR
jgi:hypothetical protein